MSYLMPKRVTELENIDSDIETPEKATNTGKSRSAFVFPKRVADLELSDSEDDKNDRLNCALLNDSFILSPSQEIAGITPARSLAKTDENNRNTSNLPDDSGIYSRIKDLAPTDDRTEETIKPIARSTSSQEDDPLKIAYRPIKTRQQLFPTTNPSSVLKSSHPVPSIFKKIHENSQNNNNISACVDVSQTETPFKKADDPVFLTPSLRPPSQSTIKKSQNIPLQTLTSVKEKPSAKILFTTPVPRPPTMSLIESTPLDVKKLSTSTATCKKLSPIVEPTEKPKENTLTINSKEYQIDKKIGSGGSSSVFLARESSSGKEVAVKLVHLDGDQAVIDGYLNETKLLAKLQGNINVVSLFDYCHLPEKNILYMVMEKGESDLHKILQGYRTHLPLYTLVKYWYQMLQAVNYIHANGVIHSDLKPANFLMINGRLKLIDFGIASNIAVDSTSIIKFSQAGTFNYISPEALIDTSTGDSPSTHHQPKIRLSTKSDVWSLGCILYLLLFKKTPFSHIKLVHQKVTALTNPNTVIEYPEMPSFYPPILVDMTKSCLVYNPKLRASVADLLKYPFEMLIPLERE